MINQNYVDVCDKTKLTADDGSNRKGDGWFQVRYLVVFMSFLGNTVSYIMRVNVSVAIVAMTLNKKRTSLNSLTKAPMYEWTELQQSFILSSFYGGYILMSVPFGYLSRRFGPRLIMFIIMFLSSLSSFSFVSFAALGWQWACVSRFFLGLFLSAMNPCCHTLLAKWSPPDERGRLSVYCYTGQQLGIVLAMSCSGLLSAWAGWPWVFYLSGTIGLIVATAWLWLVADSPAEHRLISPQERSFIQTKIAEADGQNNDKKELRTPWSSILTSAPVWGALAAHCAAEWGLSTLLTQTPSYLNGVFDFQLAKNGVLSALPYVTTWIFGLFAAYISDSLLRRKKISVGASRKIANSVAQYGSALGLLLLGFASGDPTSAVICMTLTVTVTSAMIIGFKVNYIDLSPNFAGMLFSIGMSLSGIMSALAPLFVGLVITDTSDGSQWQIVFTFAAAIYILGNTSFLVFGSGEVQKWNEPKNSISMKQHILDSSIYYIVNDFQISSTNKK